MPSKVVTQNVAAGQTTATMSFQHDRDGLQWIVWQYSLSTNPNRVNAAAIIVVNGGFRDSTTNAGSATSVGPPAWRLDASDVFTVFWGNVQPGDQLILNLLYEEVPWGQLGSGYGLV